MYGDYQYSDISIRALNAKRNAEGIGPECRHLILIEPLLPRDLEVLQLIVDGNKNPIIAQKLYIAKGTVKTHVRNILRKLRVNDPCGICEAARTELKQQFDRFALV